MDLRQHADMNVLWQGLAESYLKYDKATSAGGQEGRSWPYPQISGYSVSLAKAHLEPRLKQLCSPLATKFDLDGEFSVLRPHVGVVREIWLNLLRRLPIRV